METASNPGSYQRVKLLSYGALFRKVSKWVLKFQFRKAVNHLIAGLANRFNALKRKREKLYRCSVCGNDSPFFYAHANDLKIIYNSICPHCNSRSRHRGLFFVYQEILRKHSLPVSILHFAPEPVFYPLFKKKQGIQYQTTDLFLSDVDFKKEDIQNLNFSELTYDLVLCNHVIEHVPDDEAALAEMSRILKTNGKAIITIPGDFSREETIYFNHLRYNGHYRDYGMDVLKKMNKYFTGVECLNMHSFEPKNDMFSYGIRPADIVFICKK